MYLFLEANFPGSQVVETVLRFCCPVAVKCCILGGGGPLCEAKQVHAFDAQLARLLGDPRKPKTGGGGG